MGYYHINFSKQAINLCTIIISLRKYWYENLQMGVSNSPDIFQEKMNENFRGFEFIWTYIDDLLLIIRGNWFDHLEKLELTL